MVRDMNLVCCQGALTTMRVGVYRGFLLVLAAWVAVARGQELSIDQMVEGRSLLRRERPVYRNFAISNFTQYPNHYPPYADAPQAHYGPLGSYLTTGYDLYSWSETRQHGQEWGSSIFKHSGPWIRVFDNMALARDGHGSWGYSAIVGDAMLARFTPLTLSKANFNGFRADLALPSLSFTALGSRVERPRQPWSVQARGNTWESETTDFADDSTLLLGSRAQIELGNLQLGLNWVNQHVYRSTQPGNSTRGVLRPAQPLVDWIIVRFADDSPLDGVGGAEVREVRLIVNGEARPDLAPRVLRHQAGITPQVGKIQQATGQFRATRYNVAEGRVYRAREIPLFADYLYRLDHADGIDVSKDTNLDGLLADFDMISPEQGLLANGEEQIVFLFDLRQQPVVESVEVEALLSNDYRVDVAQLSIQNPRGQTYVKKILSTFYRTVLRSRGNVQDGSNLRRVRFEVGEHTSNFVYSADIHLHLPRLEIRGEYARSTVYGRYPAQREGRPAFASSPRFAERGAAYYVNAIHSGAFGRLGGEYFAILPDFQTEMRTFLDSGSRHLDGRSNHTVYWRTVEDNDDGDRYPDQNLGYLVGVVPSRQNYDVDGVFPSRDVDHDGTPDTNRNLNAVPDYDEPFLLYDVEPNDYFTAWIAITMTSPTIARMIARSTTPTTTTSAATTSSPSGISPEAHLRAWVATRWHRLPVPAATVRPMCY